MITRKWLIKRKERMMVAYDADSPEYLERLGIADPKIKAQRTLQKAVLDGEMARPDICDNCKETKTTEAHHEDYENPLTVEWLCRQCHRKIHAAIQRMETENIHPGILVKRWMKATYRILSLN